MDVKIVKIPAFTLVGYSKLIDLDKGYEECPKFWDEHFELGRNEVIMGVYAVCIDENVGEDKFKYMICDNFVPTNTYPKECETMVIPEKNWAIFKAVGPMPDALQDVNTRIWKEWLPNNPDYEIDGGYNIEYYSDISLYPKGTMDPNYVSEIWIPIKKK